MSHEANLQLLTLAGLAHRCAQETDRFFRRQLHDPRFCFELFRRAILHRNQHAWELIYAQYTPLVAGWVERHSAFSTSGEEVQYFVNRAFEKMWTAVTPEKFDQFSDLKSVLRYLQMCVHSTIIDEVRSAEEPTLDIDTEVVIPESRSTGSAVEDRALTVVQREAFWQLLSGKLNDEKEHIVVHSSWVLGLKPRQVYAEFEEKFEDVNEVYRIKQNVLDRLRRDSELKKFMGEGA